MLSKCKAAGFSHSNRPGNGTRGFAPVEHVRIVSLALCSGPRSDAALLGKSCHKIGTANVFGTLRASVNFKVLDRPDRKLLISRLTCLATCIPPTATTMSPFCTLKAGFWLFLHCWTKGVSVSRISTGFQASSKPIDPASSTESRWMVMSHIRSLFSVSSNLRCFDDR